MFKANINDIQTALHDEKCGGDEFQQDDFWGDVDEFEGRVSDALCTKCAIDDSEKNCAQCLPFASVKEALFKARQIVQAK